MPCSRRFAKAFRTPRFDLDSLYGRGPDDQPYLYQDRAWTPSAEKARSGFDAGAPLSTLFGLAAWTTDETLSFG